MRMLFGNDQRPIQPAGGRWGSPNRSLKGWERDFFPGKGTEPACFVRAGFQFDGYRPFFWKIDRVSLARFGQAIGAVVHKLIMRLGLPPLETCEEINHVLVSLEHHHRVISTPVDPASAR